MEKGKEAAKRGRGGIQISEGNKTQEMLGSTNQHHSNSLSYLQVAESDGAPGLWLSSVANISRIKEIRKHPYREMAEGRKACQ